MTSNQSAVLCKFPDKEDIISIASDGIEEYTQLEDYWMKREGVVFYPFDRNQKAYFFAKDAREQELGELELFENPQSSQGEFETSVLLAQDAMSRGEFDKVVLARNECIHKSVDSNDVFDQAVRLYPESFVYHLNLGWEQWVGASPELLLEYENGYLRTVALAGTRSIGSSFGEKEVEEQRMVEEFIEEKFTILGLNEIQKSNREESSFGSIKHLKTSYVVKADQTQALEAVKHLHPTSAVCGLPRDKSFEFLSEYESLNRGFYSGLTGVLSKNKASFYVNLRCMRIRGSEIELFAGAGITAASEASKEWEETEKKIASIKRLLD